MWRRCAVEGGRSRQGDEGEEEGGGDDEGKEEKKTELNGSEFRASLLTTNVMDCGKHATSPRVCNVHPMCQDVHETSPSPTSRV